MEEALRSYRSVKDGYVQLLRSAAYKTGTERQEAINALENQNRRLQEAVQRLLHIYETGKSDLSQYSGYTAEALQSDLDKYKKDLKEMEASRDDLATLQGIYGASQSDIITDRYTYFGYIIVVLVLLIIDFVLFVTLSFTGSSESSSFGSWFGSTSTESSILPSIVSPMPDSS